MVFTRLVPPPPPVLSHVSSPPILQTFAPSEPFPKCTSSSSSIHTHSRALWTRKSSLWFWCSDSQGILKYSLSRETSTEARNIKLLIASQWKITRHLQKQDYFLSWCFFYLFKCSLSFLCSMLLQVLRLFTSLFLPLVWAAQTSCHCTCLNTRCPNLSLSHQHKHTHYSSFRHTDIAMVPPHVTGSSNCSIELTNNQWVYTGVVHIWLGFMSTLRMSCKNHLSWLLGAGMWNGVCVCVCVCVCGHWDKECKAQHVGTMCY